MDDFRIKTEQFEGPLDLLLSLIEKRKLLINEFSLSKITDEFIAYAETIPGDAVEEKTDFIVIASTLLLIKSRSLLPNLSLSEEEEQSIDQLEKRLELLKKAKELGEIIKERFGKNPIFFAEFKTKGEVVFAPHKSIEKVSLSLLLHTLLNSIPKKEKIQTAVIKKVITIEEMIEKLAEKVKGAIKMSFREFTGGKPVSKEQKVEVIVGFLAMLELVKQGIVDVSQHAHFEDIHIESKEVGLPHYG